MERGPNTEKSLRSINGVLRLIGEEALVWIFAYRYQRIWLRSGSEGLERFLKAKERKELARRMRYLRSKELIKTKMVGDRLILSLTEDGERRMLENDFKEAMARGGEGRTLVMYDIPESQRKARDCLRWFLKRNGFRPMQLSVWSHPKDVAKPVLVWINKNGFEKWVQVVRAPKIHDRE